MLKRIREKYSCGRCGRLTMNLPRICDICRHEMDTLYGSHTQLKKYIVEINDLTSENIRQSKLLELAQETIHRMREYIDTYKSIWYCKNCDESFACSSDYNPFPNCPICTTSGKVVRVNHEDFTPSDNKKNMPTQRCLKALKGK